LLIAVIAVPVHVDWYNNYHDDEDDEDDESQLKVGFDRFRIENSLVFGVLKTVNTKNKQIIF
jgi:hypothetical protein